MKILHLETGRHLYGGAKQVEFLVEGLAAQGVVTSLCCPSDAEIGRRFKTKNLHNIQLYQTSSAGDIDLRFYRQLKRIILQVKPDIVHLHSRRGADVLGALAARSAGIKCVVSRRVDNPENQLLAKLKYRLYDHVITISEGIRRVLLQQGIPADLMSCVRSAVDCEKYQSPKSRQQFVQKFALRHDALTIGMIAQLIGRKGHKYVLAIAKKLKQAFPELTILVFGQGPKAADLKQLSHDLHCEHAVRFVGFHHNIEAWLGNLDIVVHPAEMEGLGVALLQSAAAGVPIVASRVGGIPEIVRHRRNGLLINRGDSLALYEALAQLLAQPQLRQTLGAEGRRIAREEFSIAAMVEGNWQVYRKLLANNLNDGAQP